MINLLTIFTCLVLGYFCRFNPRFPAHTSRSLNLFIIYLSLPALIFVQMPKLIAGMSFTGLWWLPVSMAWINFGLSFFIFSWLGKKYDWSKKKTGALILTAGLGNTSFIGFPLMEVLIGPESIPIGILVDQPGSFLVLSTLGIITAASFSGEKININDIIKRVVSFPPFIALLSSIGWFILGEPGKEILLPAFDKIALTLVPLALFSVGFQSHFNFAQIMKRKMGLGFGLSFKLILAPLFFILLYKFILGQNDFAAKVTMLEASMATMITSAVVASEFHLDEEIANLMLSLSILLSFFTVPLWKLIIF